MFGVVFMKNKNGDDSRETNKNPFKLKSFIAIQGAVIVYTFAGVAGKAASEHSALSKGFILFYGIELMILGVYAVLWQQLIKKFDLSVAYANRSVALLWSMLWAFVFFNEDITFFNILGALIVVGGTLIVNGGADE